MDRDYARRDSSPAGGRAYDGGGRATYAGTSDAGSSSAAGPSRAGGAGQPPSALDEATSSAAAQKKQRDQDEKARRAYRACTNCRTRKAKCDLGDIDNPKDPPCARCKREKRECTFLPSRRGGNLAAKAKAKQETVEDEADAFALEPAAFDAERRTSFVSGSTDGSATKRLKFDDGRHVSMQSLDEAARPRSTSNVSSWSTGDLVLPSDVNLDMWSGMLLSGSAVNHSPLAGSGTLPTMQTSPLSFTTHLTAPNFHSGGTGATSARHTFSGGDRPSLPSLYKSFGNNAQISPTAAMPPPPERTSPTFVTQKAYAGGSGALEPPLFAQKPDPPPLPSAFPPPSSSSSAYPALPPPPPISKTPLLRRSTGTAAASRPENFITAGMANEADALSLLAMTATGEKPKASGKSPATASELADTPDGRQSERSLRSDGSSHRRATSTHAGDGTGAFEAQVRNLDEIGNSDAEDEEDDGSEPPPAPPPPLAESDLIRQGALTRELLIKYVDHFFRRHHQIFPMIPVSRMPRTELDLQRFAQDEKHLLAAMVIIASRHDAENPLVHGKVWDCMSNYINTCVVKGRETCVGFVESMLLLSENLPRQEDKEDGIAKSTADTKTWDDSTQSWFFVGHAVRTGYLLGLDQQTLYIDPAAPTTPELNRERLAWTYCYLFDRHISLRIGKAFWSRGPGLCFTPNDAFANFPSLRPIPNEQADLASVVQAMVELTQQMTTAHDVLYPSKDRTISLVRAGEYYKYIADFSRSINSFEAIWKPKTGSWPFPCADIIFSTFHYLRLYIYAFAFQAHVQRADEQGLSAHSKFGGLFPRGTTQSPDAKFIFESIDAAKQLLLIATERLHPGGALPYVPARIFGWISFASSFLLKAVYSGAVAEADAQEVVGLIQNVIYCLANSSPDKQHLGIRHALLLRTVMKQLKTAFHSAEWVSHTGTATPLFPERWHIPLSRPASPERPSATGGRQLPTGGPAFSTAASSSAAAAAALPASPWPGGLAPFLPPAGFGTPSVLPDTHGGGDGGRASQDWLAGFGDLLGASPLGGGGTGTAVGSGGGGDGASGGGGDGGSSGLGELAFLDMELGSSWWTNVLPPEANQQRR